MSRHLTRTFLLLLLSLVALTATGQSYRVVSDPTGGMIGTMVPVPGGSFVLPGTDRPTVVKPFLIGAYEVTQREYDFIMDDNPSYFTSPDKSCLPYYHGQGIYRSNTYKRPVESITWYEALEYCNRLSLHDHLTPVYTFTPDGVTKDDSADGYRLPTEAEWMWAAMAADAGQMERKFSGERNIAADYAWYRNNGYTDRNLLYNAVDLIAQPDYGTKPVGTRRPNPLGIYDMSGNVWEWCEDWYGHRTSLYDGPSTGTYKVAKGGSFHSPLSALRLDYRRKQLPDWPSRLIGLRVVRSLTEEEIQQSRPQIATP